MQGMRLGKYLILDKLGEGGMGEVWRARDEQLNRSVAIKILPPDVSTDPSRRARFEQEARALAALNHPNIVAVYEAGQHEGRAYIVSELVEGEPLRAILNGSRPPLRRLMEMAAQIAEALAAAHHAGIVHRDLKPENIMVTPSGRVKVLDFGLAKQSAIRSADVTATLPLTHAGTVMGTVGYMSPEQVRGEEADHRSDIFSFGVVLFEMLTGKRAFQAASSVETMNAILHQDPPPLDAEVPVLPPAMVTVVHRCLEKRPEARFQSAADLAFALQTVALTGASGTFQALKPPVEKRRRWLLPSLAALGAALLFAAGFLVRGRTIERDPPRFQQITFQRGLVSNARFTADGRNVVYGASWDGNPFRVYMASPGNPEPRDLGLPDGAMLVAVSSKDDLALLTGPFGQDGTGTLSRGSVLGGQMRPLLEGVRMADWAPDGSSLAVLRSVTGKFRLEYPVGKVLADNIEWPFLAIRVSPDGSRVAYASYYKGTSVGVGIIDSSGKGQWLGTVSGQTSEVVDPLLNWSPDGREIWFRSFDLTEWGTIYAIDLKGRRRVVTRVPSHATIYDIARNGRVLLRTDSRQVGILGKGPGDKMERDLSCLDASNLVGISDDGQAIVTTIVGESGGPMGSVYLRKTDGSPPIRVGDGKALDLSPDGKWISGYAARENVARQFLLFPTGAGEEFPVKIPTMGNGGVVVGWLPGDRQYVVIGELIGKRWQCFAWDASRNTLREVCPEGIPDAILNLSPDRQWVLSRGPKGGWFAYPVAGGAPREVQGISAHDTVIGWRADNRSIYIAAHRDSNKTLPVSTLDIVTGQRTAWMEVRPMQSVDEVFNLRITPDGSAYAYNFRVKSSDLYTADGLR